MPGGEWAYDNPARLQGGLCARLSLSDWDRMSDGPADASHRPTPGVQARWDEAKEVCVECPLFVACHEQAWDRTHGVWGGTDQYERYLFRKRRSARRARERARAKQAQAAAEAAQAPTEAPEEARRNLDRDQTETQRDGQAA